MSKNNKHSKNNHPLRRLNARIFVKKAKRRELRLQLANGTASPEVESQIERLTAKIQALKDSRSAFRKESP